MKQQPTVHRENTCREKIIKISKLRTRQLANSSGLRKQESLKSQKKQWAKLLHQISFKKN